MIHDFSKDESAQGWRVVDDVVMGGRSEGNFEIDTEGHGHFFGTVSLENNGGFSSIRHRLSDPLSTQKAKKIRLKIKGDGKRFQFRIKAKASDYYSYIQYFETSGEWETVDLKLKDFYASFRGRKLDIPNYDKEVVEELSILIANYKAEEFDLQIDSIELI